jgi:hypothetical protein
MPATRNTQTGAGGPPGAVGSPGGGHRHLGPGRRRRSGTAPHGSPDVGALAREAVISFLQDAAKATAEREAVRADVAATGGEAAVTAAASGATGDGASKAGGLPATVPESEAVPRDALYTASNVGASHVAAESMAWRAAAISVAALDRIEAAAAKVEADIAVALRAYAELQAGAGAAAEAAVHAAQSARASAGVAVEAEQQVRISLRQVRQYMLITVALVVVVIIVLAVASSPVH